MSKTPPLCPITTTAPDNSDYDGPLLRCVFGLFHDGPHVTNVPDPDGTIRDYHWGSGLGKVLPATVHDSGTDRGLLSVMKEYRGHWPAITERLARQLTPELGQEWLAQGKATALIEEAESEIARDDTIERQRITLYEAIHQLRHQALKARAALARLEGDTLYDPAYADAPMTVHLLSFLEGIQRDGAAAWALLATDEHGNMR